MHLEILNNNKQLYRINAECRKVSKITRVKFYARICKDFQIFLCKLNGIATFWNPPTAASSNNEIASGQPYELTPVKCLTQIAYTVCSRQFWNLSPHCDSWRKQYLNSLIQKSLSVLRSGTDNSYHLRHQQLYEVFCRVFDNDNNT